MLLVGGDKYGAKTTQYLLQLLYLSLEFKQHGRSQFWKSILYYPIILSSILYDNDNLIIRLQVTNLLEMTTLMTLREAEYVHTLGILSV